MGSAQVHINNEELGRQERRYFLAFGSSMN